MTSKQKTKSFVNKATKNDRNPTGLFLLNELVLRTSSITDCQTMEDLLLKKLAKNKPYIKYKVLRIIKHLSENGSLHWCRAWQRNKVTLIEAQHYRGERDPIYGDAPFEQVRKAAKEALQSVFAQRQTQTKPFRGNTYSHSHYISKPKPKPKPKPKTKVSQKKTQKPSHKYERQWVNDIVNSAGIGGKIHESELQKYVKQFESLSKKHILKELNKILTDAMWQKQAKALVLIERLMNGKSSDYIIDYFCEVGSVENIQTLQNSNKSVIRRKANAIMQYFDINDDTEQEISETIVSTDYEISKSKNSKVLGLLEPSAVSLSTDEQTNNDMFKGMSVTKDENNENDMFKGMSVTENDELLSFFKDLGKGKNINDANHSGIIGKPNRINDTETSNYIHNQTGIGGFLPANIMAKQELQTNWLTPWLTPRCNANDPFAEIINGVSLRNVPKSQVKNENKLDHFAEFSIFSTESKIV